ncbi:regulatory TetR family protein [Kineococcus xinjiangensis]|uniref:Regulatory TetR family protein n=1 Tax=Kineococcus xinjiangensis TaxID=512762 RepID=A0A2S6ISL1_9ACTN|nr:TetR/AcrR family transcriptional regulator [Kineococcus xinjiangensis]PPK97218.1 regulatory TetR family protein [Kineococcus xinjiangensis]
MGNGAGRAKRPALSGERILRAAVELADRDGLAPLTMRSLARHLGVEAMSLYHHVASKDALLDGMVDLVFAEFHHPRRGGDWAAELRLRAHSARAVLLRHPWAVGLMNSRSAPGLETLRHHDAVLGCLRAAGFSVPLAAHAFAVLDAHLYGFVVQELSLPFRGPDEASGVTARILGGLPPGALPHLVELATQHVLQPGYDFGDEFGYGLDLVLEGLERRRAAEAGG